MHGRSARTERTLAESREAVPATRTCPHTPRGLPGEHAADARIDEWEPPRRCRSASPPRRNLSSRKPTLRSASVPAGGGEHEGDGLAAIDGGVFTTPTQGLDRSNISNEVFIFRRRSSGDAGTGARQSNQRRMCPVFAQSSEQSRARGSSDRCSSAASFVVIPCEPDSITTYASIENPISWRLRPRASTNRSAFHRTGVRDAQTTRARGSFEPTARPQECGQTTQGRFVTL
jgi:hypothetical protein